MTAHVVFTAIDPVAPATTSVTMVHEVIRGFIGFGGLLMSDDLFDERPCRARLPSARGSTLAAACDVVLHCNGSLDERRAGRRTRVRRSPARRSARADCGARRRRNPAPFDVAAARRSNLPR
jgi:beta-N-acetylhexosaminidase